MLTKKEINISVVVPTYRRPVLLQRCLQALDIQQFEKNAYEIIIVSDGPDEETENEMAYWSTKSLVHIRYIALSAKKGPAAARNAGWQQACGRLIAFTDDDCLPQPGWLQAIWQQYRQETEIAYTGRVMVPLPENPTDFERNTQGLEKAAFITANCVCTRKVLERVGGFDEAFKMAWREDSDLEFKLLEKNIPILPVKDAIVIHPVRKAPWGVSLKDQKKGMFNALLYKKYPLLYKEKIGQRPPWNYYVMIGCVMSLVVLLFLDSVSWGFAALLAWLALVLHFIVKRLSNTNRSLYHMSDMVVTSMLIPFLSVFWQLYGAWKYKVLFF